MENVKRIILAGDWTPVQFSSKSRQFFIKNFTDASIYVSFEENDDENTSIKISKGVGETVAKAFISGAQTLADTVYIKGTGEVEVQALEIM